MRSSSIFRNFGKFFLFYSIYFHSVIASKSFHMNYPQYLSIGGLFTPFDEYGKPMFDQAQCVAAFNLAIDKLNNDPLVLPHTIIRTSVASGHEFFDAVKAADQMIHSFNNTGVEACVGALDNIETEAADQYLNKNKIVQVHSVAMDTILENGEMFKYKLQTVPIESYYGMVLQDIICDTYKYQRITILSSNDERGAKSAMEAADLTFCDITQLNSQSFRTDQQDFTDVIDAALQGGAQVFLIFAPTDAAARLLEQGYRRGLFREDTQIFGNYQVTTPELLQYMDPKVAREVLKGFIGLQYAPSFSLGIKNSPGQDFVRDFHSLPPSFSPASVPYLTTLKDSDEMVYCNNRTDTDSDFYFYRSKTLSNHYENLPVHARNCSALNFSSFTAADGSDIYPFAAHVYDATYSLGLAFDHLIYEMGYSLDEIMGDELQDFMMKNISFTGATGFLRYFEGQKDFQGMGHGDREVGHTFLLYNFHQEAFDKNSSEAFRYVGYWQAEHSHVDWCHGGNEADVLVSPRPCYEVIYNTVDGLPALDQPPPIILGVTGAYFAILIVLSILCVCVIGFFGGVVVHYQNTKLIKNSQKFMLGFILLGGLLGAVRVGLAAAQLSDSVCTGLFWTGHLCFGVMFGSLFLKTWRVNAIVNNQSLKRIKITEQQVVSYLCGLVLVLCVYLIVATVVGEPRQRFISSFQSNQLTKTYICDMKHDQFQTALYYVEAAIMLFGARLCWLVRSVPDAVNESPFIATAMLIITLLCAIIFPLVFILVTDLVIVQMIGSFGFALCVIATIIIIFGPKSLALYSAYSVPQNNNINDSLRKKIKKGDDVELPDSKIHPNAGKPLSSDISETTLTAIRNQLEVVKGEEKKIQLCRDFINGWSATLTKIQQFGSSNDSSNNKSSKSSAAALPSTHHGETASEAPIMPLSPHSSHDIEKQEQEQSNLPEIVNEKESESSSVPIPLFPIPVPSSSSSKSSIISSLLSKNPSSSPSTSTPSTSAVPPFVSHSSSTNLASSKLSLSSSSSSSSSSYLVDSHHFSPDNLESIPLPLHTSPSSSSSSSTSSFPQPPSSVGSLFKDASSSFSSSSSSSSSDAIQDFNHSN